MNDRFLRACRRESVDRTPIWLMRQAGRYLPEYRALRDKYDMLTMCRTPELAVEVTLQPLKHFDLDAAILFSDIMIPLRGMGVDFEIVESVGPVVANPVRDRRGADALRVIDPDADVPYVIESVRMLRRELDGKLPLIGFAGAPFTLASYIVEGKPSRDLLLTKQLMYTNAAAWHTLMDKLADTISAYLFAQIRAGAQAVQLFDSWIGALGPCDYQEFVLPHTKKIFDALAVARVPRIHFGTGTATLLEFMKQAGGDVISIDWRVPLDQAWQRLGDVALQGNLDPAVMLTTPEIVERHARGILAQANGRRGHIFNLGHGVLPNTPMENVERLVEVVHSSVVHKFVVGGRIMTVHFSEIEKEVIYLKAIYELIDAMVNFQILDLHGNDPDSSIMFKSTLHQKYFNIVLVDFLSRSDIKVVGEAQTYLDALRSVCNAPNFSVTESVKSLALATNEFIDWLEQEIQVETWLPSINTNAVLSIKRIEFLRICGNISKHNFSRLSGTANELTNVLERNHISIDLPNALLALGDFYERFHIDILNYAASTICEFLNNIRWGIYEYLQPEFSRSIVRDPNAPPSYTYTYPNGVKSEFAKSCYWDLMNEVRSPPYMRRFKVTRWLKLRAYPKNRVVISTHAN